MKTKEQWLAKEEFDEESRTFTLAQTWTWGDVLGGWEGTWESIPSLTEEQELWSLGDVWRLEREEWSWRDHLWKSRPPGWEVLDLFQQSNPGTLSWWEAGGPCWKTVCPKEKEQLKEWSLNVNSFYLPEPYRSTYSTNIYWARAIFQEEYISQALVILDVFLCFSLTVFHMKPCPKSDLCWFVIKGTIFYPI